MIKKEQIWNKYFLLVQSGEMTLEVAVFSAMEEFGKAFGEWLSFNCTKAMGGWLLYYQQITEKPKKIDELLKIFNDEATDKD